MSNATKETKKNVKKIEMVKFPTLKTPDNEGLKAYLKELGRRANMSVKTWEKVPGRHAVEAYGRNIALVTVNKNGKFSVHTNEKMLSGIFPKAKIIKNGALSVYATKCDNQEAVVILLEALTKEMFIYRTKKELVPVDITEIDLYLPEDEAEAEAEEA